MSAAGIAQIHATHTEEELDWQTGAVCAQVDSELFFPPKGGTTRPAKQICYGCVVRADCLSHALMKGEWFGIWGGFSDRERRQLIQTAQRDTSLGHKSIKRRANGHGVNCQCDSCHVLRRIIVDRAIQIGIQA